ncbi:hypothetical protein GCM10010399_53430 [Dactylosporangium fulvum]|uniref:Peptidase C39 domain-containing protein n=1 Tax=Dactylosporangium fulvum TaxID=53359 RepID=A0ABY5VY87_9ACTN|nr:hypothetical protein [Dactylosporangium fulvum]UWP81764.1 hypothetical protein Dfulv_42820 [Dactylosporangium fulvum]
MELQGVRQTDGFTCGPTVAMVASANLDPAYAATIDDPAAEQHRIHRAANRIWPRKLGTTPWGVAAVISSHAEALGTRYGWKLFRQDLGDVVAAVESGWPVPLLVGRIVPRHWVLIVGHADGVFQCFNPSSGRIADVPIEALHDKRAQGVGFPRPYAVVLPSA